MIDFISILPDWETLANGLNAVILAPGEDGCDGWHDTGVVAVCAWERKLWRTVHSVYYREHRDIFKRLGVPCEKIANAYCCKFNETTVRAFQLLHILLHELGHHHDRMSTRSRYAASRGEAYAEEYARRYERIVWNRYLELFAL